MIRKIINPLFWLSKLYILGKKWSLRSCGSKLHVSYPTTITGSRRVSIGNRFTSMGTLYLYASDGGEISIGDNCFVNTNVQIGATPAKITIGNNVLIAPNVVIRAADHGINRDQLIRLQPSTGKDIVIEDDVWIGSNAVVTGGVILAQGTVVAAGAVVTKSTEPYSIVAGIPAKKISERV